MGAYAVAVHARPSGVLLASADGDGVRLLAAAAPGTSPADAVAEYFGDDPPAVVVRVGTTPFSGATRALPVPVAVAALAVGPAPPDGPVLVVDAGPGGVESTLVEGGVVVPARDDLRPVEIVLAGERAVDDPGWVATVTRGATCPVRVAGPVTPGDPADVPGAGPDTAAVLGAAVLGAGFLATPAAAPVSPAPAGPDVHRDPGGTLDGAASDGPDRGRYLAPALALLGAVLVVAGLLVRAPTAAGPAGSPAVVQYGYRAALPAGWEHTGGDPARRRVLLTPAGRADGADLVVVERSPLGYDAGREPRRARRELAALLAGRTGTGPPEHRSVAGRDVLGYTQHPGDGTVVDWHVLFDGADQLVVGCRRPEGSAPDPACAAVVGSVRPVR